MSLGAKKLTIANAKDMQPGDVISCDIVNGLQLRRRGKTTGWYFYYRTRAGVRRKPAIGRFPTLGIDGARRAARELAERVAKGEDPSRDWREAREAPTVAMLWGEYLTWLQSHREASTVAEYTRQVASVLLPHRIAAMAVKDVRLADVEAWLADVRNRSLTSVERGKRKAHSPSKASAPKAANRALAIMSGMMKHAELRLDPPWRERNSNPCRGVEQAPAGKRDRYATAAELGAVGAVLHEVEATHPVHVAMLVMHLITGARTGELAKLRWADVAADRAKATLTHHKTSRRTGGKVLLLAPEARGPLERMSARRHDGSDLVFAGLAKDKPLRAFWEMVREKAGCPDLQIRDLRRTYASLAFNPADGETINARIIGSLLGHTRPETTQIYTVLFAEVRQNAVNETAARATALLGSKVPEAKNDGSIDG